MSLPGFRVFKIATLVTALAASSLLQAHPLDFLTPEQRVFMMNKFLQVQNELVTHPGQAGAADGSGATPLTPEQRVKLINWFMSGSTGETVAVASKPEVVIPKPAGVAIAPQQPAPAAAIAPNSEAALAAVLDQWGALTSGVKFERFRDGFAIDGARYLDPEGRIVAYGFDTQTGDFTYLVQSGSGQFVLKTGRATSGVEPVEIGKAELRSGLWAVSTASGKKFSGTRLIPLARGFLVARDNTGYRYVPGKGMTSFAAPEQFSIAALQSGNVSGTGYLLLERTPEDNTGNNSLGALLGSFKALGSTLGISKKEDYALLNIDTKKLVPINISMEDKRVQVMSRCRKINALVADCAQMDSYDSLFQPNGTHNMTHYFWRINWFNANGRPVLVSQEGGLTKVAATDLNADKKVMLCERAMGIASFNATQDSDGKINVSAQMGFSTETKNDVVSMLDSPAAVPSKGTD